MAIDWSSFTPITGGPPASPAAPAPTDWTKFKPLSTAIPNSGTGAPTSGTASLSKVAPIAAAALLPKSAPVVKPTTNAVAATTPPVRWDQFTPTKAANVPAAPTPAESGGGFLAKLKQDLAGTNATAAPLPPDVHTLAADNERAKAVNSLVSSGDFWHALGDALGQAGVAGGQTIALASEPAARVWDAIRDKFAGTPSNTKTSDAVLKAVQQLGQESAQAYTPSGTAASSLAGKAGSLVGSVASIAEGGPEATALRSAVSRATTGVDQGESSGQALVSGALTGIINEIGMRIPITGKATEAVGGVVARGAAKVGAKALAPAAQKAIGSAVIGAGAGAALPVAQQVAEHAVDRKLTPSATPTLSDFTQSMAMYMVPGILHHLVSGIVARTGTDPKAATAQVLQSANADIENRIQAATDPHEKQALAGVQAAINHTPGASETAGAPSAAPEATRVFPGMREAPEAEQEAATGSGSPGAAPSAPAVDWAQFKPVDGQQAAPNPSEMRSERITSVSGTSEQPTPEKPPQVSQAPSEPAPSLPTPHEVRVAAHVAKAREQGLTPAQTAVFMPEDVRDPVTGFYGAADRLPAIERAQQFVERTGRPAVYVEADIANLGGVNARLGHTEANDRVYTPFAQLFQKNLEATGGRVIPFKHGGDEMSAVVAGAKPADVQAALTKTEQDAHELAAREGLADIPHPKYPGVRGTGLYTGMHEIDPKSTVADIPKQVDTAIEDRKKEQPNVYSSPAGETATVAPGGQTTGIEAGAARAAQPHEDYAGGAQAPRDAAPDVQEQIAANADGSPSRVAAAGIRKYPTRLDDIATEAYPARSDHRAASAARMNLENALGQSKVQRLEEAGVLKLHDHAADIHGNTAGAPALWDGRTLHVATDNIRPGDEVPAVIHAALQAADHNPDSQSELSTRERLQSSPFYRAAKARGVYLDLVPAVKDALSRYGAQTPRAPGESQANYARRLMSNGTGEIRSAVDEARRQQKIGRANFRAVLANRARSMEVTANAFHEAAKYFDKQTQGANLKSIDEWENGHPVTDPTARKFFELMDRAFQQRIERLRAVAPDALKNLIEHYFPHIWEDPGKASAWYQSILSRGPLEGNRSFLKQRTWGTIKEGMASGLKPVSTNPVDLALLKLQQMDKFITLNEFRQDLEQRGWLKTMKAGERVPDGYGRIEDPAFKIAGGLQGYHAVPELIAQDINRYLEPGLYKYKWWRGLRFGQNVLLSARLGLSAFHAGFTTMDTAFSHLGAAFQAAVSGDLLTAAKMLGRTVVSPVLSPFEGRALYRKWYGAAAADADTAAVLHALELGGARGRMNPTDYTQSYEKLFRAIRQRDLAGTALHAFPAVLEGTMRLITHYLVPWQKMAARAMLMRFELNRYAGALGKGNGDYAAIVEAMHPDTLKQIAGRVVQDVDDRLGQMAYDNLFMNRIVKDVSQATIQSVAWNIGTFRTIVGAAADTRHLFKPEQLVAPLDKAGRLTDVHLPRLSSRLGYLIALNTGLAALGSALQFMLTGQPPQSLKDMFYPRTGRMNPDGSAERISFPTYLKDEYALARHPLATVEHKLHPSIEMALELLNNQNFYGGEIRNPDDPFSVQAQQVAEYLAQGLEPYAFKNEAHAAQAGGGIVDRALPFVGVTPAPADIARSQFQAFVAHNGERGYGGFTQTPEQAAASQRVRAAEDAIRTGQQPDFTGMSEPDVLRAERTAQMPKPESEFMRLGLEDKLRAYDMASPEERTAYHLRDHIFTPYLRRSMESLPDADRAAVVQQLQRLYDEPAQVSAN